MKRILVVANETVAGRPLIEAVNMSVAKTGKDDARCGSVNKDILHAAICRLNAAGITVDLFGRIRRAIQAAAFGLGKDDLYFEAMRAGFADARDRLAAGLGEAGYEVLPAEGTYFISVDLAASGIRPVVGVVPGERHVTNAEPVKLTQRR